MHTVEQARPNILLSRVANTIARCDDQQQQLGPQNILLKLQIFAHQTVVVIELRFYVPRDTKQFVLETVHFPQPISWLITEETKPNTTLLQALHN